MVLVRMLVLVVLVLVMLVLVVLVLVGLVLVLVLVFTFRDPKHVPVYNGMLVPVRTRVDMRRRNE